MLMRQCICGRLVRQGEQCICRREANHKSWRRYDQEKRDRLRAEFYHSVAWRRMTEAVRARAAGLDEWALADGRLERGAICHHIEELKDTPALSLDINNLIYVSAASHKKIHKEYEASEERKEKMKARLKEALGSPRLQRCK